MSYLAYEIQQESFTITREGPTAQVTVLVPVSEAAAFAKACVGGDYSFGGLSQYFPPTTYNTTAFTAYCNKADVEHVEPSNAAGEVARVKLTFGKLDQPEEEESQQQDPTQIADYAYEISAQELTLPKTALALQGGSPGDGLGEEFPNPIKMVVEGALTASFKRKPELNPSKWATYCGKVNNAAFRGHAAESVLFCGVSTKRTVTTDGHDSWEYSCNFIAKYGHTWNQVWNTEQASWQTLLPKQYETANFETLIENL